MTVYTTLDIVYHTSEVHHPSNTIFSIPKQPPDLSLGYIVCHIPCDVMPHNRYDTRKKTGNLFPELQDGRGNSVPTACL